MVSPLVVGDFGNSDFDDPLLNSGSVAPTPGQFPMAGGSTPFGMVGVTDKADAVSDEDTNERAQNGDVDMGPI